MTMVYLSVWISLLWTHFLVIADATVLLVATNGTAETGPGLMQVGKDGFRMLYTTPPGSFPAFVAVNAQSGSVVWTDWGENRAIYETFGETHREVTRLNLPSGYEIEGVAIDGGDVYYVVAHRDIQGGFIKKNQLNGNDEIDLITTGLQRPRAITVYSSEVYWTDWGTKPSVSRANKVDGSNIEILLNEDNVHCPNSITIDAKESLLFWCDCILDKIGMLHLDDSKKVVILKEFSKEFNPRFFAIAVDETYIYLNDWRQKGRIGRLKRTTKEYEDNWMSLNDAQFAYLNGIIALDDDQIRSTIAVPPLIPTPSPAGNPPTAVTSDTHTIASRAISSVKQEETSTKSLIFESLEMSPSNERFNTGLYTDYLTTSTGVSSYTNADQTEAPNIDTRSVVGEAGPGDANRNYVVIIGGAIGALIGLTIIAIIIISFQKRATAGDIGDQHPREVPSTISEDNEYEDLNDYINYPDTDSGYGVALPRARVPAREVLYPTDSNQGSPTIDSGSIYFENERSIPTIPAIVPIVPNIQQTPEYIAIQRNFVDLTKGIDVDDILNHLFALGVLGNDIRRKEEIESKQTSQKKTECLVQMFLRNDTEQNTENILKFVGVLQQNSYRHLADKIKQSIAAIRMGL